MDPMERDSLERQLQTYQRNVAILEGQIASFGGEQSATLALLNQLDFNRSKVAQIRGQLGLPAADPAPPQAAPTTPAVPPPETAPRATTAAPEATPAAPPSQTAIVEFQAAPGGAQITWRANQIGSEVTPFGAPYDDKTLPLAIRALDAVQYPNYPQPNSEAERRHFTFTRTERSRLAALGLWQGGRIPADAYRRIGQQIYDALGPDGQRVLKAVRNAGIAQGLTTSYVLRFPQNAVGLAALPWEALWDQQQNQSMLLRADALDSCERYIDIDRALPPPATGSGPLRLLALSPKFGIPDDVRAAERDARLKSWEPLRQQGRIVYDELTPLTTAALGDYLLDAPRPDLIHYFGHGIYKNGKGCLLFDTPDGGRELVEAERLAATFGKARMVMIHACQSAMVSEAGGLLTGVAPALSLVTGAVVAMQLTVRIDAATRFSRVFYNELLGKRASIQQSVAVARQILFSEGASWYVPTLYIRSREQKPFYLAQ